MGLLAPDTLLLTVHSVLYSEMKSYAQTPSAKPSIHAHEYASYGIERLLHVLERESVHAALCTHGLDTHSLMSISQCPPRSTVQLLRYCRE